MDKKILAKIRELRKPFTKELVEGWHKTDLDDVDRYLEKCFKFIFKSLEDKGFFFEGIERVCPVEFFNLITKSNGSGSKGFEIAKNSFFGVRLKPYYINPTTGVREPLKQPLMFLPFTNEHGDIYDRNSLYSLQLVLSERGPSVDGIKNKTIFIRVLGFKFKVSMELYKFIRLHVTKGNVARYPMSIKLPANRFYNSRNDRRINEKTTPTPLLAWYVFAKYGIDYAMKTFAECEYYIGYEDELIAKYGADENWDIYVNNNSVNPKCLTSRDDGYEITPGIAIRYKRLDETNSLAFHYAVGILFMFDVFAGNYKLNELNNPEYWKLIIGYCSIKLGDDALPETYLRQMNEHIISVEEYADEFTIDRYNKSDIPVKDTYELFNHLIINFSNIIKTYNPADLLHKELASKEFLLENLIHAANDFKFKIRSKTNITPKIINRELDFHFNLFRIDKSIRENNTILEQTGTDNPFIDYGLGIIRQTKSTISRKTGSKKDDFNPNHPGSLINASQPFVTSYQFATKPNPDGTEMLTPRVCLRNGKYTAIHDDDRAIYEATKKRLMYGE